MATRLGAEVRFRLGGGEMRLRSGDAVPQADADFSRRTCVAQRVVSFGKLVQVHSGTVPSLLRPFLPEFVLAALREHQGMLV